MDSNDKALEHYFETYMFLKHRLPSGYKIFNYQDSPLYNYYNSFFEFTYQDIHNNWHDLGIAPCYFYFIEEAYREGRPIKAYASSRDEFKVIGISYQLIEDLKVFIDEKIISPSIGRAFSKTEADISINEFVHQCCILFIYYHELGHVIQCGGNLQEVSENRIDGLSREETVTSHVLESDADHFAANLVIDHVVSYWRRIDKAKNNQNNLETIVTLVLVGIFTTFDFLSSGIRPFYTLRSSHPHEIYRITLVSGLINRKLELLEGMKTDRKVITTGVFQTLHEFRRDISIRKYLNTIQYFHKEIAEYTQLINDAGYEFPNLASFKMESRASRVL